jgi:hypothetical protein
MASLETRENWRPFYFNTRNLFLVTYRNYPFWAGLLRVAPRLAVLGFYAVRHRCLLRYFAGIRDGLAATRRARALRRPIAEATLKKIAALRRPQPGWIARFARHWKKAEF